jgi:arylsulfatase A-like enzyme
MAITRRAALTSLSGASLVRPQTPTRRQRPNILFIMTDDHPVSGISCYGNRILKTPNLDRIADEGVRFDNCFVTNSLCAPARATVLSGCYSHINGVRGNSESLQAIERLNPKLPTFPALLRDAGYHTGIVGKWHLSHDPAGFDYWCVLPGQGLYFNPDFIENGRKIKLSGHATDIVTDVALDFLRKRDTSRPFCLLYNHKGPHRPFQPAPRHARMFSDVELPHPKTYNDDYRTRRIAEQAEDMQFDVSLAGDYSDLPKNLSAAERKNWIFQRFVKDHYRTTYGIDEGVGRVLDYLDKNGLAASTLVIYTTDNGFFLGEHGWYDKRFMYEPSFRIPLLVRYPDAFRPKRAETRFVANIDFAPTILDFAGLPVPQSMQGSSLRPLLEGKPAPDWRQSVYYTYYENSWAMRDALRQNPADPGFKYLTPHRVVPHRGVRTDRHKLIEYYGEGDYWELFDLKEDPHELSNLYGSPDHARTTSELKTELKRLRTQYEDLS